MCGRGGLLPIYWTVLCKVLAWCCGICGWWLGCVRPVTWDLVGVHMGWVEVLNLFGLLARRCSVFLGAGWACCHRFHFFGRFYGICDTIGREPVTNSIFFAVFMESATHPRSTLVRNVGCCHKFHFFSRFYGICDSRDKNITNLIGCAYQTAGKAAPTPGNPARLHGNRRQPPRSVTSNQPRHPKTTGKLDSTRKPRTVYNQKPV
ncbi:hypothetical protein CFREI_05030 [Corynebacterium freiburgense]|nr:hypothetical protein CFREI_05030 [Corynebacterium freiburgense]